MFLPRHPLLAPLSLPLSLCFIAICVDSRVPISLWRVSRNSFPCEPIFRSFSRYFNGGILYFWFLAPDCSRFAFLLNLFLVPCLSANMSALLCLWQFGSMDLWLKVSSSWKNSPFPSDTCSAVLFFGLIKFRQSYWVISPGQGSKIRW